MIALVPAAFLWQRKSLWTLCFSALLVFWPIMGLNVSASVNSVSKEDVSLRIMTYNIHRWGVTAEEFSELLSEVKPDIVAIQECAPSRWKVPPEWQVIRARESLVVSRYPITRLEKISTREPATNGLYCEIETPLGHIGFCCIDLLTPRRALTTILNDETIFDLSQIDYAQKRIAQRWKESQELSNWMRFFPEPIIMAGDFNLTVDSPLYRESWSGFQNAYSQTEFGYGYTKKTKINIFRYKTRIDHILSTRQLRPVRCWVGPDYGSDHLPLIADFVLNTQN
jgi:endonuclease/exonuclease/phosphatase family metal-dependent hydrolase